MLERGEEDKYKRRIHDSWSRWSRRSCCVGFKILLTWRKSNELEGFVDWIIAAVPFAVQGPKLDWRGTNNVTGAAFLTESLRAPELPAIRLQQAWPFCSNASGSLACRALPSTISELQLNLHQVSNSMGTAHLAMMSAVSCRSHLVSGAHLSVAQFSSLLQPHS